ncbi:hypothetical protein BDZ91DRAFT_453742 [Kalaharituber pfeilii]|nr:hypothetical protein BDZ91DRAFT_453742 [Kalaharituber pfeilii]
MLEYDLCRIEPQYYVGSLKNHNGVSKCLFLQLENHRDDHNIVSKAMFVRRIPKKWNKDIRTYCDAMDCIPVQEVPEYRSANCYYIRSKAIPHEYWHLQHGYVHVSHTERTSFCIARALGDKSTFLARDTMAGYETIMILDDRIIIAVVDQNTGQLRGGICPLNEFYGPLVYRQQAGSDNAYSTHDYTLRELLAKRCFHVLRAEGQSLVSYNQSHVGENWELV